MRSLVTLAVLCSLVSPLFAGDSGKCEDEQAMWISKKNREKFGDAQKVFEQVKATLMREYVDEKISEEDLYRAAVAGMLRYSAGRKWDVLISPEIHHHMSADMSGEIVGIGIEIKIDDENGTINLLGTIPGSPAERAGLQAGDRILKVDGKSLKGGEIREVASTIRGKAGTSVTLTVLRDDSVLQKVIKREPIVFMPVQERLLPGGVGLVTVHIFTEKTPSLLKAALKRIAAHKPRALIVDLRENEGGLFDRVIDCAGLLLPRGTVLVEKIGRGEKVDAVKTADDPVVSGIPVAVLVSNHTASGAEILSGALRDTLGARLVGAKTAGKWNVQKLAELPNGYVMKYTIGLFRTPKGQSPDGKGLEPDVAVAMDEASIDKAQRVQEVQARLAADPQLRAALAVLQR